MNPKTAHQRPHFGRTAIVLSAVLAATGLFAQSTEDLMNMSLDDILKTVIVSASKKAETVFDSPLSISVVTREEILNSGATSIPDALRLVPGMIIREQTNGVYDVHARGLDNMPPNHIFSDAVNKTSLIMIDNRIVYNYLDGGTFWESLPIDLNDVERIEVIRGPASALYGPNAVTGVIHIITRDFKKEGLTAEAAGRIGGFDTRIANASLGFRRNAFRFKVTGNAQTRDRYQTDYYIVKDGRYEPLPDSVQSMQMGNFQKNMEERYPDPSLAVKRSGINAAAIYEPTARVRIDVSGGYQDSRAQNLYVDVGSINFTTCDMYSRYADFKAKAFGFTAQTSVNHGSQTTIGGVGNGSVSNTIEAGVEYLRAFGPLTLNPGLSYKRAEYKWSSMLDGKQALTYYGFSLRADMKKDWYRLVAAARGDKYNAPDKIYPSYEFAAMIFPNSRNTIRAVASRASRAAFLADTYFYMDIPMPWANMDYRIIGNTNLRLMTMDMVEIGFRSQLTGAVQLDVETFYNHARDFDYYFSAGAPRFENGMMVFADKFQNLKLKADQTGATASLNWSPGAKFQAKVFATVQKTQLKDFAYDLAKPDSLINQTHRNTPDYFGGFQATFKPWNRFTLNATMYAYGSQLYDHADYKVSIPHGPTLNFPMNYDVKSKILLNVTASYSPVRSVTFSASARNLLNSDSQEFGFADKTGRLILGGVSVEY
jgi:iron complex outermembrane recepter protein